MKYTKLTLTAHSSPKPVHRYALITQGYLNW